MAVSSSGPEATTTASTRFLCPLAEWPLAERRHIAGVFTDIDDTLTTEGAITADALAALHALHSAGLHVIPITGRPVGWSEAFAATWPVDAVVAENGAVALLSTKRNALERYAGKHYSLSKVYQQDEKTRTENLVRMQEIAARVLREIPGTTLAQDSGGRETDIAIDHSEFAHLPQPAIDQVVALLRRQGMQATVSSIHINAWFGDHDKLSGARWILRTLLNRDLDSEIDQWVYVGDSTNDQTMFAHFTHSVGVANIARFVPQLKALPRYVTVGERGKGFAEVAAAILEAKAAPA
jgi:HAD superfamily hydrolase (TIGR01484 family)